MSDSTRIHQRMVKTLFRFRIMATKPSSKIFGSAICNKRVAKKDYSLKGLIIQTQFGLKILPDAEYDSLGRVVGDTIPVIDPKNGVENAFMNKSETDSWIYP